MTDLMSVAPFDGSDDEWNGIVSGLPDSTFCHLAGWRAVFADVFGHESIYLVAENEKSDVEGALPLVRVKSRIFGDYLLSMPFLSYGGPLGSETAKHCLVDRAVEEARRLGVDLLELRARGPLPGGLSVSDRKLTVLKTLPGTSDELWEKGLRAKVRSQVRRPMKEGLEGRIGRDRLDDFYLVFSTTMRDLGTPVLPKAFFESVLTHMGDHVILVTVERDGAPVAAGFGFVWEQEVEITWAGALREHSRVAPNMLLYWEFMKAAIERGAELFNFGRCSPDSGTHKFKKQWGSEDHALPWAQWSASGVAATPNPTGRKYELATGAWQRLPLPVANTIGPWIARSLP